MTNLKIFHIDSMSLNNINGKITNDFWIEAMTS